MESIRFLIFLSRPGMTAHNCNPSDLCTTRVVRNDKKKLEKEEYAFNFESKLSK